jgi:tetratricopeptide (TPR) repeat protein
MTRAALFARAALSVAVITFCQQTAVALGEKAEAGDCGFANSGSASGISLTCNFGLTSEQMKQVTEAAVKGATEPLTHQIVDISKTLGVTEGAAKTLLKNVGEDPDVSEDKLAEALSRAAEDYKRLQIQVGALNPDNPRARELVAQAKPEIDAGHFARAHELLRQATEAQIAAAQEARKLREQAEAAADAEMLGAANSTAAEGGVVMIERRYKEAAELFARAADYVPAGHPGDQGSYLAWEAAALYQQGDERGDNDSLQNSVEIWRRVLTDYPRERAPLQWAATQNNLGAALEELGERERGTALLEEAVVAYGAALEERTRERDPFQWAGTENNLGNAFEALGERGKGAEKLKEAVAAYSAAMEVWTRARVPLNWAMIENNVGGALEALGDWEDDSARLGEAVKAYRAALQERTRERVPLPWAQTQANLGDALRMIGQRKSGTAGLNEAVSAFNEALKEFTPTQSAIDWASTFGDQGVAMSLIADRTNDAPLSETAVAQIAAAYEALQDRGHEKWATMFAAQLPKARAIRDRLTSIAKP